MAADAPLPRTHVSSALVGGAEALRLFQDSVRDLFETAPDGLPPNEVVLDMTAAHLGGVLLGEVRSTPQRFSRGRRMVAGSGVDHLMIQLYTEGGYEGVVDDIPVRVEAGDVSVLDLTRTLRTRAAAYRNLTLVVPRALLEAGGAEADALHGRVLPRDTPVARVIAAHLEALWAQLDDLTPNEAEALGRASVAMLAALLGRVAAGSSPAPREPVSPRRQLLRHIETNLSDPALGPAQLMERFGLSRAALYRLLEPVGGVSALIRERRLKGAALELASESGGGARISEVARRWGFADEAAFSRAFRLRYGVSPSQARTEAGRVWARAQLGGPGGLEGAELAWWIRNLQA